MLRMQMWWLGDERVGILPFRGPCDEGRCCSQLSISHPVQPGGCVGCPQAAPSFTDLLSELHPGAGDGLGACHFTKQLHGLSSTHLSVLRKLNDLRGHGWRGQVGK